MTSPTVFGYISNVQSSWSCTAYFRYSGITWNTSATLGTFAWGNLINSDSVACNFVVGSTDYVKGNSTADCPDTDAEYARSASLGTQGVYQNDLGHDSTGDFSFVQTDCASYYGASPTISGQSYSTADTGNRPNASNCDPIDLDSTNTTQTITYDSTNPTVAITAPPAGTSGTSSTAFTVTFNPSDNVAGFGGTYLWSLQRQIASLTSPGVCGAFANDTAAGNLVTGSTQGSQTNAQTLLAAKGYRWVLTAEDQNGNGPVAVTSGCKIPDLVNPVPVFSTPATGTTTTQSTLPYTITWSETEAHSGIASRSLQRQRVASTTPACPGTFTNDGTPVSTVSGLTQTLAIGNCYQWVQTLTDGAGRTGAATSGKVFVDAASPSANFSTPNEGTTTMQTATSYTVAWTETAGSGSITARSLQRQKGPIVTPSTCAGVSWANDGSPSTAILSVNSTGLTGGNCYRWIQTLTNSGGKIGATTSGSVLVDTTAPAGAITTPLANQPSSGAITITGQATDAHSFKEYQLEYGAGATPASWTSIGIFTNQVSAGGTLYSWTPGALSGVYTIRLTVRENAGNTAYTTNRTVVLENAGRGDESYLTRVPFELGGGYTLDVGVHNGEARLSRELFSIPSYGPPQALGLSYSSLETSATGKFGVGWTSNLTQYLTFDATDITIWHRSDGGRVPFGKVAGSWVALAGHFEALSTSGSEVTITQKDQTKLVFESTGAGRLKRIENRYGKALTLNWSTNPATATDATTPTGRVTNLTVDATNNRITVATDSAGRAWSFGYTGTGASSDLTSITDPAGKITNLVYSSHLMTEVKRNRIPSVGGTPAEVKWTIGYTSSKATAVTDPVSATVASTLTYNSGSTEVGLLKEVAGPVRNTSTYAYDDHGRVHAATDPAGFTTTTTFDAASSSLTVVHPIDAETAPATTTYTYDSKGNVLSERTPIDASTTVVTKTMYNATNDMTSRWEATGETDTATTPDQLVTKYAYDGSGHLTSINVNCTSSATTPPVFSSGCTGNGTQDPATNLITSYTYTANHQLENETDPLGRVTRHVYDGNGNETGVTVNWVSGQSATNERNVTTSQAFAANQAGDAGLATSTIDPLSRTTSYTYDALGRRLTEVLPGETSVGDSIPVLTRTTTHDEFGNVLTEAEQWTPLVSGASQITRTTSHAYDLTNRETTLTDPAGIVTTTAFDAAGDATSTSARGVVTERVFDGLGRALSETTDNGTTTHEYDAQGNDVATASAEGEITAATFSYTGWLLTETADPDPGGLGLTTTHTYDRLGRETTATSPTGAVSRSGYDRVGRACRTVPVSTQSDGTWAGLTNVCTSSIPDAATATVYDRAGNAVAVKAPDGAVAATLIDPLNRTVTSIANCTNTATTQPAVGATCAGTGTADPLTNITTRIHYDADGATIAIKDPKGITTRTIVNLRGLPKETIANCTDDGTTPPSTSNPATCTADPTPPLGTNIRSTVTYDGQGSATRTIVAVGTGDAEAKTETAYDAAGRVQAVKDPMGTITRSFYDPVTGQMTKTVVNCSSSGTPPPWMDCDGTGTADGTWNLQTTYGYDGGGHQTSLTAPNGRLTVSVYDGANRLFTRTDNYVDGTPGATDDLLTTYFYDEGGRTTAVQTPTADGSTFTVLRSIYNADGTLASEIRGCTDLGTTPPANPGLCTGAGTADAETNVVTSYGYDTKGNRISVTAPDPSATLGTVTTTVTTQSAYDAANRLCRVVENTTGGTNLQTLADPCSTATQGAGTTTANMSTRYTYDPAGNLASMIDAASHTTAYGYDAAGRLTSLTDATSKTLVWAYDDVGNRIRQENRSDPPFTNSVAWTYDGAGRVLTRTADGVTATYTYDDNGNKLTASDGTLTITSTYDRLNRVLTVDDEDAGTTADTTYTYSLTSPSWTDPTGTYGVTLDKFDRATVLNDPVNATNFTTAFRADGQPASSAAPNGNTTAFDYDDVGQLLSKDTTGAGQVNRALYDWTYNRAGQILTENSQITGDPSNDTRTTGYDPLGRLTGSTIGGTTTTYGWDRVPNRTSVQTGAGTPVATTYDAANRPKDQNGVSAAYTSDNDGRLTTQPDASGVAFQRYEWDDLGRLTKVKPPSGGSVIATYTYDPLDRLRMADYGGSNRVRFRYVGLTTSVAQTIDDQPGTVIRHFGTGWGGERLLDWTGSGSNIRVYGENAHHDVTWTASSTGAVSATLRYDPWGKLTEWTGSSLPDHRFQGSWYDTTTELAWVVTRWYAPTLGRFLSEDSLLGEPRDPDSRHLYAYAEGEPIVRWDPDGQYWYRWQSGDTTASVALRDLGKSSRSTAIYNTNRNRVPLIAGRCVWVPRDLWFKDYARRCFPRSNLITGDIKFGRATNEAWAGRTRLASAQFLGSWRNWYTLSRRDLVLRTKWATGRSTSPYAALSTYRKNESWGNSLAIGFGRANGFGTVQYPFPTAGITIVHGSHLPPPGNDAATLGHYVFIQDWITFRWLECCGLGLLAHEYIHVLQWQGLGYEFGSAYIKAWGSGTGPSNRLEAPAYVWESRMHYYAKYGEAPPWSTFKPLP